MIKSGLAHCCHHDKHYECCYDFNERVKYIKAHKPKEEQALRLKLFALLPMERLPLAWQDAYKALQDAYKARQDTPEGKALHDELFPDCTWDGKTIFPLRKG